MSPIPYDGKLNEGFIISTMLAAVFLDHEKYVTPAGVVADSNAINRDSDLEQVRAFRH